MNHRDIAIETLAEALWTKEGWNRVKSNTNGWADRERMNLGKALDSLMLVLPTIGSNAVADTASAFWKVKNGYHFHDEPPPSDTSDSAAIHASLVALAKVLS